MFNKVQPILQMSFSKNGAVFALFFAAITPLASAQPRFSKSENLILGRVNVVFKPSVAPKAKLDLHRKLGGTLVYRSKNLPIDLVSIHGDIGRSARGLETVCDKYRSSRGVEICELIYHPKLDQNLEACPSKLAPPTLSGIEPLVQSIVERGNNCELIAQHGQERLFNNTLTPFWAQELVGTDLVRDHWRMYMINDPSVLLRRPTGFFSFEPVNLGAIAPETRPLDLGDCQGTFANNDFCKQLESISAYSKHGTAVVQLVADPIAGTALSARLTTFGLDHSLNIAVLDRALERQTNLLCSSLSYGGGEVQERINNKFMGEGGIVVQSAGNDFGVRSDSDSPPRGIIVSSISPHGLNSYFTSPLPNISIAAPSDHWIQAGSGTKFSTFGGTSGAQPLVCGVVANLISMLPGIQQAEAQKILEASAVPLAGNREGERVYAKGMLNGLRAYRAAERLVANWPQNRTRIANDASLFNFVDESDALAASALPALNSENSCAAREALLRLRSAFLLNPENREIAGALENRYTQLGLTTNAAFYRNIYGISDATLLDMAKNLDPDIRNQAIAELIYRGDTGKEIFKDVLAGRGLSRNSGLDVDTISLAAIGSQRLGTTLTEVQDAIVALYERPGGSQEFNEMMVQLAVLTYHVPAARLMHGCIRLERNTIFPPCLNLGIQDESYGRTEPFDLELFRAMLRSLEGNVDKIESESRSEKIREIAKRHPEGRAFIREQTQNLANSAESRELMEQVLKDLESK